MGFRCLEYLRQNGHRRIEAQRPAAGRLGGARQRRRLQDALSTCNSWYMGANIPGKRAVFMVLLGFPGYVTKCQQVAADGYQGFTLGG